MRRREAHSTNPKLYDDYYLGQVGHGLPVFTGTRMQRGHGLGNVLSGLVRAAMPLVKRGVKTLGRQGLKTGMQIAGDVMAGQKPKAAVRRRAKQASAQLVQQALRQFAPPGQPAKGIKRPAQRRSVSSSRATKRSKSPKDIFSR